MRIPFVLTVACATLFLIGCVEKPNPIGDGLTESVITTDTISFYAVSDSSYTTPLTAGSSSVNLTGRVSPTEELISLYSFTDLGTIDSLIGARIDTAELRMTVISSLTPTAPPIRLYVHEVLQSWSASTFTTDSMMSFPISAISYGTFSDSMNVGSQVSAQLDSQFVRRWVNAMTDTGAAPFYGLALMAEPGPSTGVIGFYPFDLLTSYGPHLVIKYTKNGTSDSVVIAYGTDTYAARFSAPPLLAPFEVRGGFGVRAKVRFDVSALQEKPMVGAATLTLTMDTLSSVRGIYSPDSLVAMLIPGGKIADSASTSYYAFGVKTADAAGGKTYTFNITTIAQRWINGLDVNEGLAIRWAYEMNSADKIVFHSSTDADVRKRPKLKITYSRQ